MITLIPKGGLGNRINAICSTIAYCQQKNRKLKIIWFNEFGLKCSFDKLFVLNPQLANIEITNGKFGDFILKDQPRQRNLWLPSLFSKLLFDKCIYWYDGFEVANKEIPYDDSLEKFSNILFITCGRHWESPDMWQYIIPTESINKSVLEKTNAFSENTIGLHIRRTDNLFTIKYSPTRLYIEKMEEEIKENSNTTFFLASDSLDEKRLLITRFGDRIITSLKETDRNTEEGIIDAFVEMNILGKCKKIYGGDSSFAEIAGKLGNVEYIRLEIKQ